MALIKRNVFAPHEIGGEHRHKALASLSGRMIEQSTGTLTLYNVKSHFGIIGNERANVKATAHAKGEVLAMVADAVATGTLPSDAHVKPT